MNRKEFMLAWDKKCETGVKWQDIQHKDLFGYIFLAKETLETNDHEKLRELLDYLKCYTRQHFEIEEAYMQEFHDPEYNQHFEEHKIFKAQLQKFIDDVDSDSGDQIQAQASDILDGLWKWYLDHILGLDINLGKLIKKHGMF